MRARWYLIASVLALAGLIAASALGTDYPHDETNPNFGTQFCGTCHIAHNGFGTLLSPSRGSTVNQLCESCHYSGGPAPKVLTHGSSRGQPGCDFCTYTFEVACTNCHNPHMHQQPYENDPIPDGLPDAFIRSAIRPWTVSCNDIDCEPGQHRNDETNACIANAACPGNCSGNYDCVANPSANETICSCPIGYDSVSCTSCVTGFSGPPCTADACSPGLPCGYGTCVDQCTVEDCLVNQHREDAGGTCVADNACVAGQCTPANGGACLNSPIDGSGYCDCPIGTTGSDCATCASGPGIGFDGANCTVDCNIGGDGADCGYGGTCITSQDCGTEGCGGSQHRDDTSGLCTADNDCATVGDVCTSANLGSCEDSPIDQNSYCDCPVGTLGPDCSTCASGVDIDFSGANCTVPSCDGRVGGRCGYGGTCVAGGGSPSNSYPTTWTASGRTSLEVEALTQDGVPALLQARAAYPILTVRGFPDPGGNVDVVAWVRYRTSEPPSADQYSFVAAIDGVTFNQWIVSPTTADVTGTGGTWFTASLNLSSLTAAQVQTLAIRGQITGSANDRYNLEWDVGYIVVTPAGGDACNGTCTTGYGGTNCDQCAGGYTKTSAGTCVLIANDPCTGGSAPTCNNGGQCYDVNGTGQCDCPGWYRWDGTGAPNSNCNACDAPTGLGCDGPGSSANNPCALGYTGPNCDQCDGPTYVASNGGTCVQAIAEPCDGVSCGNGGTCFDNAGTAECDCPDQYHWDGTGAPNSNCNSCANPGNTCQCDPKYAGPNCDQCNTAGGYVLLHDGTCGSNPCASVTCGNGGTCYVDENGAASCDCVGQYYWDGTGAPGSNCNECDVGGSAALRPIVLVTEAGFVDSFADGEGDDLGICETCHTQTSHHTSGVRELSKPPAEQHNISAACTTCHIHAWADSPPSQQGGWGFMPTQADQTCEDCHLAPNGAGTQDVDSWAWDGTKALIDQDEYYTYGHGTYDGGTSYECGGGRASFGDTGRTEDVGGCAYCHDRNVSHNTKGNYFRLRNWGTVNRTDGGPPQNDTCLACHHQNAGGFDPGDPIDQVFQRDASAGPPGWVDMTAEFNDTTPNDWVVFPVTEAAGDYAAFGRTEQFNAITIGNAGGAAGDGTGTVVWEYWDGTGWAGLSGVYDGTVGFTLPASSKQSVVWTIPSDWATTTLDGRGPYYYVRAVIVTPYNTTNPVYDTGSEGTYGLIDGPDIDDGTGNEHPAHQGNKHYPEVPANHNGGKFCWDCHDPHGDQPTIDDPSHADPDYYCKMIQRRPVEHTDPDGVPTLEANEVVFADYVTADAAALNCDDFRATNGLCKNCHHDGTGLHYTKTFNSSTHPENPPNNGCGTPTTDTCMQCHQHVTGFRGVLAGGTCFTCHMSGITSDAISYDVGDGTQAVLSETEWLDTGHGRPTASGAYPSQNPAANFNAQTPANGCYYCHDESLFASEHQKTRAQTTTGYFLLANYDALARGEGDAANDTCLVCHDNTGTNPGYDGGGNYPNICANGTCVTVGEAHWTQQHAGAGKSGGKLCWNCHDPHGDYDNATPTRQPLGYMIQNRPWMELDADDIPTNDPPTWSDLAATPSFDTTTFDGSGNPVFATYKGGTGGYALCGTCHDPAYVANDRCNWSTCPGHNEGTGKTKCTDCHKHTGEFEGSGECTDCHNAQQPGGSPVRRAVVADFDSVANPGVDSSSIIRSHHVGTGVALDTSDLGVEASFMGGSLTSHDCIVCHAEGYLDTSDGIVKTSSEYHYNDGGTRTIDLRDVDDPLPSPYQKDSVLGNVYPFDKSAIETRGLTYTLSVWDSGTTAWVTQTSTNLDPFCLGCHDADGASAAYALGEHDQIGSVPPVMGATQSTRGNPFFDGTITNEYDRTPRPGRIIAPEVSADPAGSVVDIYSLITASASRHAIRGQGANSVYNNYLNPQSMYSTGNMVASGELHPAGDPKAGAPQWNDESLMSCADCHTSDGSNTLGGSGTLGNAHGSDSEYMLRNASRLAAEGFADKSGGDYVCYQCHQLLTYNFNDGSHTGSGNEWTTSDTAAKVGAARVASGSEGTIFGMLCFNCHGGSNWGMIHGTDEVFTIGAGPGTRNAYRFVNGAAMRFYDPDADGSSATANYSATQYSCYTVGADTTFGECTQHTGFSKAWNRNTVRPLSY